MTAPSGLEDSATSPAQSGGGGAPSLAELARLGGEELLGLARAGKLRPSHLWLAGKGAEKYRAAVAAGDIAGARDAMARARVCEGCPAIEWRATSIEGVVAGWCGAPLEERMQGPVEERRCGCFVALKVNGRLWPGAKAWVGSEASPQGKW